MSFNLEYQYFVDKFLYFGRQSIAKIHRRLIKTLDREAFCESEFVNGLNVSRTETKVLKVSKKVDQILGPKV